jgi:hypothetical protein
MAVAGDRGPGSNGLAIASVLVGMVAVPLFFFPAPAVAAIVLGVVGHRHARDLSGEIMGVIGATVGTVVMVLFVVLVGLNLDDVTHTTPLAGAARGTCFKETYPEDVMVRKDCSKRHGSELFAIVQHPAPAGAAYPTGKFGPFEANSQALELCRLPFAEYVGQPAPESTVVTYTVDYPDEGEWRRNDRTVRCFVIAKDGAPQLTRSARDIARTPPA